jgi:alpha-1,2-mannosyltransferase
MQPSPVRAALRIALGLVAGLAFLIGLQVSATQFARYPLTDVHAYYEAAARLNAGLPLYDQPFTTNDAHFYRYPPLLAIAFRPLALLPFEVAATIWAVVTVVLLGLTIWRVWRGRSALVALGLLTLPIGFSLAVGQAQVVVT